METGTVRETVWVVGDLVDGGSPLESWSPVESSDVDRGRGEGEESGPSQYVRKGPCLPQDGTSEVLTIRETGLPGRGLGWGRKWEQRTVFG